MKNTSILLVLVLVIIIIAGGLYYYLSQKDTAEEPINANVTVVNATPTEEIPEATLTNDNWNPQARGDLTVTASGTHEGVTFAFTSAARMSSFSGADAPDGKEYLIVYFGSIPYALRDGAVQWMNTDVHLVSGTESYPLASFQVITEYSQPNETGFFQFTVPTGGSGYRIQFGEGETASTVDLGF